MPVGLQRGSPVQLSLSKDNYVALLERHGQWTRWRTAQKCSCVQWGTMQADIHCKICAGRGFTYSYQKSQVVSQIIPLNNTQGILEVSAENKDCELIEVYDYYGKRFKQATKHGEYVYLNTEDKLVKNVYYTVIMRKSTEKYLESATAEKNEYGFYTIPDLTNKKANVDGLYYSSASDIVAIKTIVDANGVEYEPKEFRLNKFRIEPKTEIVQDEDTGENIEQVIEIAEPVKAFGITYVPPFVFAILNQNLSKADLQAVAEMQGDGVCTFPYECDVASDDVLTVLSGSFTQKEILLRQDFEVDVIGAYFVYDIVSCTGIKNGQVIEYKQGEDFILTGINRIKWNEDSENCPEIGDTYSIVYHVLPTYKVVKEIPQLRTSENQRFPKKVVVKLFNTYSDNIGANVQKVGARGFDGSY